MEQIRSLSCEPIDVVANAFAEAFSDYERIRTAEEYKKMLKRRGYTPALSFGAFDEDKLVSFTLNAVGTFKGSKKVYDSGTGTLKEYRGRKLAGRIFEASLPALVENGVEQYLLEVLQHNTAAISVYTAAGFEVSREFNYYFQQPKELLKPQGPLPGTIVIRETMLQPDLMIPMWDFTPSWQNSFASISNSLDDFRIIGAFDGDVLAAYGVVEPVDGDIAQLAVHKDYRGQGIATHLMHKMVRSCTCERIQVINVETNCQSLIRFLDKQGFPLCGQQYEMIRQL